MLRKLRALYRRDDGMTTAEYAVGLIAAVAFAGILYKVVTSGTVLTALTTIVSRLLSLALPGGLRRISSRTAAPVAGSA